VIDTKRYFNPDQAGQPQTAQPPDPTPEEVEAARRSAFEESEIFPGQFKPIPEETILTWRAPSRPFKKRNSQYYTTVGLIVFLVSMILFFAGQFLPIAVVISVGFLSYVLSSVPPGEIENKITTYGIHIEKELYYWEEMGRFWFEDKFNYQLLKIETARFPGRLTVVLGEVEPDMIRQILSEVLLEEKPKDTFFDKSAKWLQEKIPLETINS